MIKNIPFIRSVRIIFTACSRSFVPWCPDFFRSTRRAFQIASIISSRVSRERATVCADLFVTLYSTRRANWKHLKALQHPFPLLHHLDLRKRNQTVVYWCGNYRWSLLWYFHLHWLPHMMVFLQIMLSGLMLVNTKGKLGNPSVTIIFLLLLLLSHVNMLKDTSGLELSNCPSG